MHTRTGLYDVASVMSTCMLLLLTDATPGGCVVDTIRLCGTTGDLVSSAGDCLLSACGGGGGGARVSVVRTSDSTVPYFAIYVLYNI
jgi:hypothetical protein